MEKDFSNLFISSSRVFFLPTPYLPFYYEDFLSFLVQNNNNNETLKPKNNPTKKRTKETPKVLHILIPLLHKIYSLPTDTYC